MSRDVVLYKTLIGGASYLQTRVLSCPLIDQHKYSEAKPPSARLNAATVARTLAAAGRQSKQLAASSAERVCVDAFTRGVERGKVSVGNRDSYTRYTFGTNVWVCSTVVCVWVCGGVAGQVVSQVPSRRHCVRLLARPCACLGHVWTVSEKPIQGRSGPRTGQDRATHTRPPDTRTRTQTTVITHKSSRSQTTDTDESNHCLYSGLGPSTQPNE